ncbi:Zn(2)-C6 fungal-type domain-containing protein [Madurella fahalii]|uniref:Zn(2)-C6 fungal-type domain-containing protein n=1 Tax=Madurella fahalii TaxID=1157608 RepID=A0ABQ0G1Z2_9PEZI
MATGLDLDFSSTRPLRFCSICGKPFDQDTSHARHEKYCQRKAAANLAARPKACHACRKNKTKCDFQLPCSRCVTKRTPCSYGKDNLSANGGNDIPLVTENPGWPEIEIPDLANLAPMTGFVTSEAPHGTFLQSITNLDGSVPAPEVPSNSLVGLTPLFPLTPSSDCRYTPDVNVTLSTLESWSQRYISTSCRQLIISLTRAFPRMMVKPQSLPPFVHRVGCGLEYNDHEPWQVVVGTAPPAFAPLRPLAACVNIAHVFASRMPNSEDFLWQTIEAEQQRIRDAMPQLSPGETLASIQAMVIYTIMRLMHSGYRYFILNREMLRTMKDLSHRFAQVHPSPFNPPHVRATRPTWEEWIYEETRRRLAIVCFLMALVVGCEACDVILNPYAIPLPGSKALWEARTADEWERVYDEWWAELKSGKPRLDTLGDLIMAKHSSGSSQALMHGIFGSGMDDVLDDWHANLDGLGMMLAAVLAGL